jgi:hypothetical protein
MSAGWDCVCGERNFKFRDVCRQCNAPRLINDKPQTFKAPATPASQVSSSSSASSSTVPKSKERAWLEYVMMEGGKRAIGDSRGARRLISAVIEFGNADGVELLSRLATSANGLDALQAALSVDDSSAFYDDYLAPLLRLFARDILSVGPRRRYEFGVVLFVRDHCLP